MNEIVVSHTEPMTVAVNVTVTRPRTFQSVAYVLVALQEEVPLRRSAHAFLSADAALELADRLIEAATEANTLNGEMTNGA